MTHLTQTMLRFLLVAAISYMVVDAYLLELNVVVDERALELWKEKSGKSADEDFKEAINSVFVEVGELFASLEKYNTPIKIRIKTLTLHAKDVVSASPFGQIRQRGLDQFRKWILEKKNFEKEDWDAAIYLTGFDLDVRAREVPGFAEIGKVCTNRAIGMVEFHSGDYHDAFVIAHVLGIILGMDVDGTRDAIGSNCDSEDGYIMSHTPKPKNANHFNFSYCSYLYLYQQLTTLPWSCLSDGNDTLSVKGKRLGELMSAEESCKWRMDGDAYLSTALFSVYGDLVCTSLQCRNEGGNTEDVFTPQGLYCGKNKQCIHGKCVQTANGKPSVSDDCPFGDSPKIDYKGYKSCDDLPLHLCGVMKDECCKRCGSVVGLRDADNLCRKVLDDPNAMLFREKVKYYGDVNCDSIPCISGYKDGRPQWKYTPAPEGLACGKNKRCQGKKCLPTRDNPPGIPDRCSFGDQPEDENEETCRKTLDPYPTYCDDESYRKRCCAFCMNR